MVGNTAQMKNTCLAHRRPSVLFTELGGGEKRRKKKKAYLYSWVLGGKWGF